MIRKIIKIDEQKCVGCGLCASACHEGASYNKEVAPKRVAAPVASNLNQWP